jgi:hypothetical protein
MSGISIWMGVQEQEDEDEVEEGVVVWGGRSSEHQGQSLVFFKKKY